MDKYAVVTDPSLTHCPACGAQLTDEVPRRCPEHGTRYLENPDETRRENRKESGEERN